MASYSTCSKHHAVNRVTRGRDLYIYGNAQRMYKERLPLKVLEWCPLEDEEREVLEVCGCRRLQ